MQRGHDTRVGGFGQAEDVLECDTEWAPARTWVPLRKIRGSRLFCPEPPIEISVEVTEENLLRYNLTFNQIARAISANNQDISAGMIRSETEEILIRSRSRTTDPAKLGEIIIRGFDDGSKLYLRDIADIKLKFSETPSTSLMNGQQSISFNIQKLPEEDLALIRDTLDQMLAGEFDRFDVFAGPITDNQGNVILEEGEKLEQVDLDGFSQFGSECETCMYWWNENITAELPLE